VCAIMIVKKEISAGVTVSTEKQCVLRIRNKNKVRGWILNNGDSEERALTQTTNNPQP
jgi:hypothetical protein